MGRGEDLLKSICTSTSTSTYTNIYTLRVIMYKHVYTYIYIHSYTSIPSIPHTIENIPSFAPRAAAPLCVAELCPVVPLVDPRAMVWMKLEPPLAKLEEPSDTDGQNI